MSIFGRGETAVIRVHRLDTVGYLVADAGECAKLARDRVRAVSGRRLVHIHTSLLPQERPASWLAAVVHCQGMDMAALVRWAARLTLVDMERVIFYEPDSHRAAEAARAIRPWVEAGLPTPVRRRVKDFKEFNRVLGNDLNWRILLDHADPSDKILGRSK